MYFIYFFLHIFFIYKTNFFYINYIFFVSGIFELMVTACDITNGRLYQDLQLSLDSVDNQTTLPREREFK